MRVWDVVTARNMLQVRNVDLRSVILIRNNYAKNNMDTTVTTTATTKRNNQSKYINNNKNAMIRHTL